MENPRIYVASLSDYNNGRLEGKWFDFNDYSDASELMGAIHDMLAEITKKYNDGEEREEWAVHDYEYIPSTLATEYMGEQDFQTIYDIIEASEEYGIPTEVLMERVGDTGSDDYGNIAESLMLVVDGNDESDIVYEIEEQFGELGFDFWQNHIYIDDVTQRVMYSEDVDRYREDIQSDNPDMDENEVERLAEEQADDEENRRNDDLIGYLEEMGYTDIPTWVSKDYESAWKNALWYDYDIISYDGKMYVFSINYSQGGNVKYEGGGMINGKYLDSLSETSKNKILQNIANHYGISLSEAEEEVRDEDAEMLYEYIANNPTLRMDVYTAIRNKRYDNGGNVQRLSDEDVARIQQAVAESRQKNQINPNEAFEFVKENPHILKLLMLKKGGKIDSENYEMLRGKIKEVEHHAKELKSITNRKKQVPAWVLAKSTRASTDMSDITHYMDSAKFDKGGNISYKEQQINEVNSWDNDEIANYLDVSVSAVAKDRNRYVREAQSVMMLSSYGGGGGVNPSNKIISVYYVEEDSRGEKMKLLSQSVFSEDRLTETLKKAKEKTFEFIDKGLYLTRHEVYVHPKNVRKPYLDKFKVYFDNGGGVDNKKRFDVDFYDSSDSDRATYLEIIIRENTLEDAIQNAIKKAYKINKNYIEFYHRGMFLGSVDFSKSKDFRKGRFYDDFIKNRYSEGGGVNVGKYIVIAYDGKSAEFSLNKKGLKAKNETDVAYFNLDEANRFIEKHKSKYLNVSKHLIRERTFNDDVADYDDFVDRETYLKLKQQGRKFNGGGGINDELPYPFQMQWEKLLNDFGKDKVMQMFPSGANGYYTSRTKGNYSDDAIRQSLKSMFNEGGGVGEIKVGDDVYVFETEIGKGVLTKKGKVKSIGEQTARVVIDGKESGYLLNNISKEAKTFPYLDMELGKYTKGGGVDGLSDLIKG